MNNVLSLRSDHLKEAMLSLYHTYQLARFLDELADYKSLAEPTEDVNGLARKETHMLMLVEQITNIDSLIDDIFLETKSKSLFYTP
jgi:hypothetical protein